MTSIRVQICDDYAPVRSALRRLIDAEPDMIVTGEVANAEEAVEQLRAQRPDVLILDIAMPGRSGLEAIPELRTASPETRILMLSLHGDPIYARHALACGADAFLPKEATADLVHAIHEVSGRRDIRSTSLGPE